MILEYIAPTTNYTQALSDKKISNEDGKELGKVTQTDFKEKNQIDFKKDNIHDDDKENDENENENENNKEEKSNLSDNSQIKNKSDNSNHSEKIIGNQNEEIELEIKDQEENKLSIKDLEERGIIEDIQPIRTGCFSPDGQFLAIGTNSKSIKIASIKNVIELLETASLHEGQKVDVDIIFNQNNHHKGSIYCIDWHF